jgi:hypothetical protein
MKSVSRTLAQMSFAEFQQSVAHDAAPPAAASRALTALWHDARGEWDQAHACAQEDAGPDGAWTHAYLHRKEGDDGNAAYWYACAGRPMPAESVTLTAEWAEIARELLGEI